jgi:hypothetical protein
VGSVLAAAVASGSGTATDVRSSSGFATNQRRRWSAEVK